MAGIEAIRKYKKDFEVVNYDHQTFEDCSFTIRGPLNILPNRKTIVCLGSAATFGRFVRKPYATLLADEEDWNVINFGLGGARFETYLREPAALRLCAKADLVVLELMSARSYKSSIFEPFDHLGGHGSLPKQYKSRIKRINPGSRMLEDDIYINDAMKWAARKLDWQELRKIRKEILKSYRRDAVNLIEGIGCPVLLLWLSQRSPDQKPLAGSSDSWSCGFPHFVDRKTINQILPKTAGLVEIVSTAGIPSLLLSLKNDRPVPLLHKSSTPAENVYYPSPEMHREAAEKLSVKIHEIFREKSNVL